MASLLQPERVVYLVDGVKRIRAPLSQLYFCRHCYELRSLECVSHEVDSHYCPSCLENMPSAEAKLKKNRCANCSDCPCCSHTLSTRATNIPVPNPDDPGKMVSKKAYYLACGFCHWTSRDAAMPDKAVASGGWQEPENPHAPRINKLLEYYRHLAQKEKLERDRKKLVRRRNYLPLAFSEKYGLAAKLKKQGGINPQSGIAGLMLKEGDDQKDIKIEAAVTVEEIEPLPEDYYTAPLNLVDVTTLPQRLMQPEFQQDSTSQLHPRHKHLLIKRSLRCRKCEHNLSKPEFNPTSVKFKIQLVAMFYVPEIRIMSLPKLRCRKESQVLLTLTNPVENITHVTLLSCPEGDTCDLFSTAKATLPQGELVLSPRDAAAEYDDLADPQDFKDDPDVVVFRKANKLGLFVRVTPLFESGDVRVAFKLRHDFRNPAPTLLKPVEGEVERASEPVWLTHHVELNLGPLAQP
ncbi:dynactin subunit 4 isoform X2 [Lethenteron reissneri]|uniref:dynactin subunit 4 isoform X2 n=1 Tax=Lethenteron reissneri TaxID=7753 RepID=UPI002AB6FD4C|nr:dynactin subunit 4 isoform X2 [Lethenteron reissneri]